MWRLLLRTGLATAGLLICLAALAQQSVVYYQAADGRWKALSCRLNSADGTVTFTLDPAQMKAGRTIILRGLPAGVKLDDSKSPVVTGISVDGAPVPRPGRPDVDLDWLPAQPRQIVFTIQDADNGLDNQSLTVTVNGAPLEGRRLLLAGGGPGKGAVQVTCRVGALLQRQGLLTNAIELRMRDVSPLQNQVVSTVTYHCLGGITEVPAVLVDSIYAGYENIRCLVDGKVMTPGETTVGGTWASKEEAGDHWAVLAWPEPRTMASVEVFWASYQGVFWSSNKLLVQVWDGKRWQTVRTLDKPPSQRSTLVPLAGAKSARLRLLQPSGQGLPARGPNIMWISEIEVK